MQESNIGHQLISRTFLLMDKMLKSLDLHKEPKEQKKAAAKRIENLKLATKDPLQILNDYLKLIFDPIILNDC